MAKLTKPKRDRTGQTLIQLWLPSNVVNGIRQRKGETGISIIFAAEKLFTWWASGGDLRDLPQPDAGTERDK